MEDSNRKIEKIFCSIFLGDQPVGKTVIIDRMMGNEYNSHFICTTSTDVINKTVRRNNKNYLFCFYDTSGYANFKRASIPYIKKSKCIIYCFSFDNRESFTNITKWNELVLYCQLKERPFNILIGNKSDLQREVSKDEAQKFAKKNGIKYFETSATTSDGINEPLDYLISLAYKKKK